MPNVLGADCFANSFFSATTSLALASAAFASNTLALWIILVTVKAFLLLSGLQEQAVCLNAAKSRVTHSMFNSP